VCPLHPGDREAPVRPRGGCRGEAGPDREAGPVAEDRSPRPAGLLNQRPSLAIRRDVGQSADRTALRGVFRATTMMMGRGLTACEMRAKSPVTRAYRGDSTQPGS